VWVCFAHTQKNAHAHGRSDTYTHEQDRFQGSMTSLERANPEVTKINETITTGKVICVLPAVCIAGCVHRVCNKHKVCSTVFASVHYKHCCLQRAAGSTCLHIRKNMPAHTVHIQVTATAGERAPPGTCNCGWCRLEMFGSWGLGCAPSTFFFLFPHYFCLLP